MKGRKQVFQLEGKDYGLARPSFSEMHRVADLIGAGEVESVLLEAAGDTKDALAAALETADHEDVVTFWGEYLAFTGYEAYEKNFVAPREAKQAERQAAMFAAMREQGLLTETFMQDLVSEMMTHSELFTTDTVTPTDGLPS